MIIQKIKIGNCTLIHGDSSKIIDNLGQGFDATVCDPPYGVNGSNGTIGKKRAKAAYSNNVFPDTPDYISDVIAPLIGKSIKISDRAAITVGGTCAGFYPNPTAVGAYVSPSSAGLCKWGACTVQPIFFYGRDPRIGKDITPISYKLNEHAPKNGHPCPKPIKAWTWLVHKASLSNHHVFDPLMGSGTTGVSCVKLGRQFTGIEINKDYFDIAVKRISEAYSQPDIFIDLDKKRKSKRVKTGALI